MGALWLPEGRDLNSGHKDDAPLSPELLIWRVPTHYMHALYSFQQHALYLSAQDLFSLCVSVFILSCMETLLYSSTSARGRHCKKN